MLPSSNVDQSRSLSSGRVTNTSWAGAVAVGWFSKSMVYGSAWSGATNCCVPNPAGPKMSLGSWAWTGRTAPTPAGTIGGGGGGGGSGGSPQSPLVQPADEV